MTRGSVESAPPAVVLPESFHGFYDPNSYFRGQDTALLGWLDDRRHDKPVAVQIQAGESRLNTREQLAVELGHLCLLTHENAAEWRGLGLSEAELHDAVAIAEFGVAQTVRGVGSAVGKLKEEQAVKDRIEQIRQEDGDEDVDILLAGLVVSANAHKGQRRFNGAVFYTHPVAATKILSLAVRDTADWQHVFGVRWLRLLQYRAATHDSFEDRLPDSHKEEARGSSFLPGENMLASPLLHKRLLESYLSSEHKQEAAEVARDNYLLTKPSGPDGHITNKRYLKRLKNDCEAGLVKMADTTHNVNIDPKEKPITDKHGLKTWRSKRREYRRNLRKLRWQVIRNRQTSWAQKRLATRITKVSGDRLVGFGDSRLLSHFPDTTLIRAYESPSPAKD